MIKTKMIEQIKKIVEATSRKYVAEQLGCVEDTVYKILKGEAISKRMRIRIEGLLRRYDKPKSNFEVPLVAALPTYQRIYHTMRLSAEDASIAIITARAGAGKTTALKSYAESHPCIYLSACSNTSATALARQIGAYFGLYKHGALSLISASVAQELHANDLMIIVDEADYLSDRALEWLRQIVHDQGGCGLVLAGLPRLIGRIHNLKADHDQLRSRVRYNLQLGGISHDDALQVIRETWADLPDDVNNRILTIADYDRGRGQDISLRTLKHLLLSLHKTCEKIKKKPSVMLVEDVAQLILK